MKRMRKKRKRSLEMKIGCSVMMLSSEHVVLDDDENDI